MTTALPEPPLNEEDTQPFNPSAPRQPFEEAAFSALLDLEDALDLVRTAAGNFVRNGFAFDWLSGLVDTHNAVTAELRTRDPVTDQRFPLFPNGDI